MGRALINVCINVNVENKEASEIKKEVHFSVHYFVLLLTLADARLLVQVVSCRTLTLEAAKGVDTVATLAEARQFLALVDVWRTSCLDQDTALKLRQNLLHILHSSGKAEVHLLI